MFVFRYGKLAYLWLPALAFLLLLAGCGFYTKRCKGGLLASRWTAVSIEAFRIFFPQRRMKARRVFEACSFQVWFFPQCDTFPVGIKAHCPKASFLSGPPHPPAHPQRGPFHTQDLQRGYLKRGTLPKAVASVRCSGMSIEKVV